MPHFLLCSLLLFLTACATPRSASYRQLYAHLNDPVVSSIEITESEYFLVISVDARHLDYTDCHSFLKTMCKHPSDGSKNGDVGHAWVYLQGVVDGEIFCIEGGHSGELGARSPRYFDGIMNYIETGYSKLQEGECLVPRYEPNPVKYLWESLEDGYFEEGSGGHQATFAVKVDLTAEQFVVIWKFIKSYCYRDYCLTGHQCTTYAVQIASLAGIDLQCEVSMNIPPSICWRGEVVRLWSDPSYALLTIATPDILEKSMMEGVRSGRFQRVTANSFKK